jgi:hypothetical protein
MHAASFEGKIKEHFAARNGRSSLYSAVRLISGAQSPESAICMCKCRSMQRVNNDEYGVFSSISNVKVDIAS